MKGISVLWFEKATRSQGFSSSYQTFPLTGQQQGAKAHHGKVAIDKNSKIHH